jgi:hypothetical protein
MIDDCARDVVNDRAMLRCFNVYGLDRLNASALRSIHKAEIGSRSISPSRWFFAVFLPLNH